jgi:hypothetical protein
MPSFDPQRFLRTAASFPSGEQQILELLIPRVGEKTFELPWRNYLLLLPRPRLFEMGQGRPLNISLFFCPIQGPLNCSAHIAFRSARQVVIRIDPLLQMEWAKLSDGKCCGDEIAKEVQSVLVPTQCIGCQMFLDIVKKSVDDDHDELRRSSYDRCFLGYGHQLVLFAECFVLVGTELDLAGTDLNESSIACRTEKRFWKVSHKTSK